MQKRIPSSPQQDRGREARPVEEVQVVLGTREAASLGRSVQAAPPRPGLRAGAGSSGLRLWVCASGWLHWVSAS